MGAKRIIIAQRNANSVARHPAMRNFLAPPQPLQTLKTPHLRTHHHAFKEEYVLVTSDPTDANNAFIFGGCDADLICYKSAVFLLKLSDVTSNSKVDGANDEGSNGDGGEEDEANIYGQSGNAYVHVELDESTARHGGSGKRYRGSDPSNTNTTSSFLRQKYASVMRATGGANITNTSNASGSALVRSGAGTAPLAIQVFFLLLFCDEAQPDETFLTWCNMLALDSGAKLILVWSASEAATVIECLLSDQYNNEGYLQASILSAGKPFSTAFASSNRQHAQMMEAALSEQTFTSMQQQHQQQQSDTNSEQQSAPPQHQQQQKQQQRPEEVVAARILGDRTSASLLINAFAVIPTIQQSDTTRLLNEVGGDRDRGGIFSNGQEKGTVASLLLSDPRLFVDRIPQFTRKKADRLAEVFNAEFPTTATRLSEIQRQLEAEAEPQEQLRSVPLLSSKPRVSSDSNAVNVISLHDEVRTPLVNDNHDVVVVVDENDNDEVSVINTSNNFAAKSTAADDNNSNGTPQAALQIQWPSSDSTTTGASAAASSSSSRAGFGGISQSETLSFSQAMVQAMLRKVQQEDDEEDY